MKNVIIKFGDDYEFYKSFETVDKLPVGTYDLKQDMYGRFLLNKIEDQNLPEKIYSNDTAFIEHIVTSFNKGENSMGILLTGKKGLGKTFTSKIISQKVGLPIIKITYNPQSKGMFAFLNQIDQPFIIQIDEFEKIFPGGNNNPGESGLGRLLSESDKKNTDAVNQNDFLAFLDGTNTSNVKKLFIITTNEGINTYLLNRPSRLRFVRKYEEINQDVVVEIVDDLLKDNKHRQDLLDNLDYEGLNIDILIKVIEEINLMDIPYSEFKEYFNYTIERTEYSISKLDGNSIQEIASGNWTDKEYKEKTSRKGKELQYSPIIGNYIYFESKIKETIGGILANAYYFQEDDDGDENKRVDIVVEIKKDYSNTLKKVF